jgi:hypothetical protein
VKGSPRRADTLLFRPAQPLMEMVSPRDTAFHSFVFTLAWFMFRLAGRSESRNGTRLPAPIIFLPNHSLGFAILEIEAFLHGVR